MVLLPILWQRRSTVLQWTIKQKWGKYKKPKQFINNSVGRYSVVCSTVHLSRERKRERVRGVYQKLTLASLILRHARERRRRREFGLFVLHKFQTSTHLYCCIWETSPQHYLCEVESQVGSSSSSSSSNHHHSYT